MAVTVVIATNIEAAEREDMATKALAMEATQRMPVTMAIETVERKSTAMDVAAIVRP